MNTNKKTARRVGVLFIIATVAGILSVAFLGSVLSDPDYLVNFSTNANQVIIGALLDLLGAGAFVGLAVVIFPILKKHNETIAIGYVVARMIEAVPCIIANTSLLAILALSQGYVSSATSDASNFVPAAWAEGLCKPGCCAVLLLVVSIKTLATLDLCLGSDWCTLVFGIWLVGYV